MRLWTAARPVRYLSEEAGQEVDSPRAPKVLRPISLSRATSDRALSVRPFRYLPHHLRPPLLRHQTRTFGHDETFGEEIAPARTFCFLKEFEMLLHAAWRSAPLDNAIVLGETGYSTHPALRGRVRRPYPGRDWHCRSWATRSRAPRPHARPRAATALRPILLEKSTPAAILADAMRRRRVATAPCREAGARFAH